MKKRFGSILLAFAMALSLLPLAAVPARAESGNQAAGWNGMYGVEAGDTVYFGKNNGGNPIAWCVLSAAGDNTLPVSDAEHALVISKYLQEENIYFKQDHSSNAWAGSDAQT